MGANKLGTHLSDPDNTQATKNGWTRFLTKDSGIFASATGVLLAQSNGVKKYTNTGDQDDTGGQNGGFNMAGADFDSNDDGTSEVVVKQQATNGVGVDGNLELGASVSVDFVRISSGSSHNLAIKTDGTLWAWGNNTYGQLGDGTTANKAIPVQVAPGSTFTEVAAGATHSLAIKTDGTLWAWGRNNYYQLGDGTISQRNSPVQIASGSTFSAVAAGGYHSLAIKSDNRSLWTWGYNSQGQLGDGTNIQKTTPVQIASGSTFAKISAGDYHSLAIKTDGSLWAWGTNVQGQLGDGSNNSKNTPVPISPDFSFASVFAGSDHSLAIKSDNTLWTWGYNIYGQLGDGTNVQKSTPVQIAIGSTFTAVSGGLSHSLAIRSDRTLWAWGQNNYGQLGDGTNVDKSAPVQIASGSFSAISSKGWSSLALKDGGTLWAWGSNTSGQLGDGSYVEKKVPVTVKVFSNSLVDLSDFSIVDTGKNHSLAIKSDGTLWAWGLNSSGQLGDGTTISKTTPVQIASGYTFTAVSAGANHSLAIRSDGTLWAWGYNNRGQLGNGTTTQKILPIQIVTDSYFSAIAAGDAYSLAIKLDGTLLAWGYNNYGQLGDGTTIQYTSPVQIGSGFSKISVGSNSSLAIKSDNTLWAWGYNNMGQLGDGTKVNKSTPVQIATGDTFSAVDAGFTHSLAIKLDGTLMAWGYNYYGQLGDGTVTEKTVPAQIGSGFSKISAGNNHSLAIKSDNTLWAWGYNSSGQLGEGTSSQKNTPVQISSGLTFSKISAGEYHSLAIKSDNTVWAWGSNTNGQLGNNTTNSSSAPVQVKYFPLIDFNVVGAVTYYSNGTYTSPLVNTGQKNASWGNVTWNTTLPSNRTILIKARSCDDSTCSAAGTVNESTTKQWANCGALNSNNGSNTVLLTSAAPSCVSNGDQFIQYQAIFGGTNISDTPKLNDISLSFIYYPTTLQKLISSPFDTGNVFNSVQKINWVANNDTTQGDVKFQIRTSADNSTWGQWCGPTSCGTSGGFADSYYTDKTGNQEINAAQKGISGNKWMQYAAFLKSTDGSATPNLSSVTLQYSHNTPPTIPNVTYQQKEDGTVAVSYTLKETYDDLGKIYHGTASAPIKALLFFQPNSSVTLANNIDASATTVTLNTNGAPIPTQGSMLIGSELMTFDSQGVTGNQRNITARGAKFDGTNGSFYTTAINHYTNDPVFFLASKKTDGTNLIHTIDAFSETGTIGSQATIDNVFEWDPKGQESNFDGKKLEGMIFKVVANDADSLGVNNIGQSSVTAGQTLDLQRPDIASITTNTEHTSLNPVLNYNDSAQIPIIVNFSENVNFDATGGKTITVTLNSGTCTIASSIINSNTTTCQYSVGETDATPTGEKLKVNSISTTGVIADNFGNVLNDFVPKANLDAVTNIIIDNTDPTADDLENKIVKESFTAALNANDSLSGIATYAWSESTGKVIFTAPNQPSTNISASEDGTYSIQVLITDKAGNQTIKNFSLTWDTTNPTEAGKPNAASLTNDNTPDVTWTKATDSLSGLAKYELQRKKEGETFATIETITDEAKLTAESVTFTEPSPLEDGKYYYQVIAEDKAGNKSTSQSSDVMMVDTSRPVLVSFTTPDANGLYGVGQNINITANYTDQGSGKIKAGSKMRVIIDIAEPNVFADLTAAQDGTTLSGSFQIQATPLRTYDTSGLNIRSIVNDPPYTSIEDLAGNKQADFGLPASNLVDNATIQVDTGGPILTGLTATSGSFHEKAGNNEITITAEYSEDLRNGSVAKVKINPDSDFEYVTLSIVDGVKLSGTYTVKEGDNVDTLKVLSFETVDGYSSPEESVKDKMGEVGNPSTINSPLPNDGNLNGTQIDTKSPIVNIAETDDVDPNPNKADAVTLNIDEINLFSIKYIFALNNDCASKSYTNAQDFPLEKTKIFNTEDNNGKYICFEIFDKAQNIVHAGSRNPFNIDVLNPTATLKVDMSKDNSQINLEASDSNRDNTGMEMRIKVIENDAQASCDFSTASWTAYSQYSDLNTSAQFVKVCASLKDAAGNMLDEISTVTPNNPEKFVLNDLTNETFTGFALTWAQPFQEGTLGFNKYSINWCQSADANDCNPDQILDITDKAQNYSIFKELSKTSKYCFKINTKDNNGDNSKFSNTICAVPGQGPVLSNTDVEFKSIPFVGNIGRNSANVVFETVNKNDSNAPLATTAKVEIFDTDNLSMQPIKVVEDSFNVIHSANIQGLESSKKYYLRITVTDPTGNAQVIGYAPTQSATTDPTLTFTTAGILTTIKNITESIITDTKAVITFITNQKAKCFIDVKESTAANYAGTTDNLEDGFYDNHSITLVDLFALTNYDYKITCTDESSTIVTSQSEDQKFKTLEKGLTQGEADAIRDNKAPEISGVSLLNVTGENATISWTTNENANSLVLYEIEGTDYEMVSGDSAVIADKSKYATSHTVNLKNLLPASKYLFSVMSVDAAGNISQSAQTALTTKEPSTLSSIKVLSKALGQATITWETNEATSSLVEYGLTSSYGQRKEDTSKVKEHSVNLSDLKPGETYHFRVKGEDDQKNVFASSDITFQPKAPPKISDFKIDSITEHEATVTYTTNVPTDSLVIYTDVKNQDNSGFQGKPEVATKHETKLKNLASGTEFSIKLKVRDEDGNETEEAFPNFTTAKDEVAPKIERVKTDAALTQNDKVQAIISWSTDELSTGEIIYREGKNGNEKKFEVNKAPALSHTGVITSFKSGVVYYFKVISEDQAGNKVVSNDYALLTPKERQNIIQIIIGNFTDIFGWAKF